MYGFFSGILPECPSFQPTEFMADSFNYTTIFAPLGFFLMGIVLVLLLNRFIGKSQGKKAD